jgi:hypothetical protein
VALAADESENWPPVNLAKFGKRGLCLPFIIRKVGTG